MLHVGLTAERGGRETRVVKKKRCWGCYLAEALLRLDCSSSAASCLCLFARMAAVAVTVAMRKNAASFVSSGFYMGGN